MKKLSFQTEGRGFRIGSEKQYSMSTYVIAKPAESPDFSCLEEDPKSDEKLCSSDFNVNEGIKRPLLEFSKEIMVKEQLLKDISE